MRVISSKLNQLASGRLAMDYCGHQPSGSDVTPSVVPVPVRAGGVVIAALHCWRTSKAYALGEAECGLYVLYSISVPFPPRSWLH